MLGGAKFNVYYWENSKWVNIGENLSTCDENGGNHGESSGELILGQYPDTGSSLQRDLEENVLYMVEEKEAPIGYLKSEPVYFQLAGSTRTPQVDGVNNVQTLSVGQAGILNVYDEKITDISVRKIWNDNNDNDGKRPPYVKFSFSRQ